MLYKEDGRQRLGKARQVLEGVLIGALGGMASVAYRFTLARAATLLTWVRAWQEKHPLAILYWFLLLVAMAFLVYALTKWEPSIAGGGIPRVAGELQGSCDARWQRVLLAKFAGGALCAAAGLSLGRAGPSAQLGAMAGKGFSRLTGRPRQEERLLLACGAAAGITATFNAPLAGVLFTAEVLRQDFRTRMLMPCMAAAVTADFIASSAFGLTPIFRFPVTELLPLSRYWLLLLLGISLGALGAFYNKALEKTQNLYERIGWKPGRLLIPFLLAGVVGLLLPQALGGGTGLMQTLSRGPMALPLLAALLAVKLLFSLASFGSGAPGGIFLPVLSIGALCGALFAGLGQAMGLDAAFAANFMVLAMAGLFAAIVRAPITAVLLCLEMTGSFAQVLGISVVCITACAIAGLLGSPPVYTRLLERLNASHSRQERLDRS